MNSMRYCKNPLLLPLTLRALVLFGIVLTASPALAQSGNGITEPTAGDSLSGIVTISGTATHADFQRYEIAFLQVPDTGRGWIVFAEGNQPVLDGVLAVWDTTVGQNIGAPVFPDGIYQLRLRVIRNDFNYDEIFVTNLVVNNSGTPTPTPAPTVTGTPAGGEIAATLQPGGEPGALPSLTPFPTPTSPALPEQAPPSQSDAGSQAAGENSQGLMGQLLAVDTGRIGSAFWLGFRIVLAFFALMALYVLLRGAWRLAKRQILRRTTK